MVTVPTLTVDTCLRYSWHTPPDRRSTTHYENHPLTTQGKGPDLDLRPPAEGHRGGRKT